MSLRPLRILLAAVVASVALFMWGFVFWTLLPMPEYVHGPVPEKVAEEMAELAKKVEAGTYVYPGRSDSAEEHAEMLKSGPLFSVNIDPDGIDFNRTLLQGWIHNFVCCALAGVMLCLFGRSLCCYTHRVAFVTLLGVFATLVCDVGETLWWFRSCGATVWHSLYHVVGWLVAGLILGAIVKCKVCGTTCSTDKQDADGKTD